MCYPSIAPANISKYSDVTVVLISGIVGNRELSNAGVPWLLVFTEMRPVPKATYDCGSHT